MSSQQHTNEDTDLDVANDIIHKQQFGVLLRIEREQQNLTQLDVAESLRLTEENIRALENSCIDELPGKAFTLGYIRSYTRLLNVPDQAIISAYLEYYNEDEKPLQQTSSIHANKNKYNKLYLISAAIAILLVVFIFLLGNDDEPLPQAELDTTETINKHKSITKIVPQTSDNTVSSKTISKNEQRIEKSEASGESTTKSEVKKNKIRVADVTQNDVLSVQVKDQSWAKIEDAKGQRLFYATLMPGENYEFNGVSPFKVFLGNAPAVELSVNQQEVDISAHIKSNNVAQITIDEAANIQ